MSEITWKPVTVALGALIPWERNPKRMSKAAAERLLANWRDLGQWQTLAVGPGGEVYDGHQRLSALLRVYGKDYAVQALQASRALTDEERARLVIEGSASAVGNFDWDALAGWDAGALQGFGLDGDLLAAWNDQAANLRELLESEKPEPVEDAGTQVDKAEELRVKWGVESGQLWKLGEHRLICGDCTDKQVVERVMGGEKAELLFTSPPYGQQRDYRDEAAASVSDWDALMMGCFSSGVYSETCQLIVNLGLIHKDNEWDPYYDGWINWMRSSGWRRFGLYIWDQGFGLMGDWNGRLAPSFEFVFHFNKTSKQPNKIIKKKEESVKIKHGEGLRKKDGSISALTNPLASLQTHKVPDSVIRIFRSSEKIRELHPAVFSLNFAEFNVETWTQNNDIVYEPFSGSGTTIIACERLGRKCRAVEISPAYCAVAIERWVQTTGGTPVLLDDGC